MATRHQLRAAFLLREPLLDALQLKIDDGVVQKLVFRQDCQLLLSDGHCISGALRWVDQHPCVFNRAAGGDEVE